MKKCATRENVLRLATALTGVLHTDQLAMDFDEISAEIALRRQKEREKALKKYGPKAIEPGGRPEFDIVDFIIGEVVGLDRYGEMLQFRFKNHPSCVGLGQLLREFSAGMAPAFVLLRAHLLEKGEVLGVTEENRFVLPENAHSEQRLAPEEDDGAAARRASSY